MAEQAPFWERKSLAEMTADEWESLCDGCGKCCLHKLEDEDSGELLFTAVSCQLLDADSCRCSDYSHRQQRVPDCLVLKPEDTSQLHWLPITCAYRLLDEGKPLPTWHPLVTGDKNSVHHAQISVRNRCISELSIDEDDWDLYIINNLS